MDFTKLDEETEGQTKNPYAAKTEDGKWLEGTISVDFLNKNFGQYSNAADMEAATKSEGLKLFFAYVADQGEIPAT